jgi:hypothetical protein
MANATTANFGPIAKSFMVVPTPQAKRVPTTRAARYVFRTYPNTPSVGGL